MPQFVIERDVPGAAVATPSTSPVSRKMRRPSA
jgi:hypothetical protein